MPRSILPLFAFTLACFVLTLPGKGQTETKKDETKKNAPKGIFLDLPENEEKDPAKEKPKDPPKPLSPAEADIALLQENHLDTTEVKLLAFFRARTIPDSELPRIEALVRELGEPSFREREDATRALLKRGPAVSELLRKIMQGDDLEAGRRAEKCLSILRDADLTPEVRAAAVRVLGRIDSPGKVPVLLAFFPYADHDLIADEVRRVLADTAQKNAPPHPALLAALRDAVPARRGVAGEVLARNPKVQGQVKPLLKDADPAVRIRVAQGLVLARDAEAVPVLIEAIGDVAPSQAWNAKDLLLRLADGKSPPLLSSGADAASRKKYRRAWLQWWKRNGASVDLARLEKKAEFLGHTVCVLLDQNQILEMNQAKEIVWKLDNIGFPLDIQVLPTGNILTAEYEAGRVTERDSANNIHWTKEVQNPLAAQRLPGGGTFVATNAGWYEFDRDGNETASANPGLIERMMKVTRLPNGNVVALTEHPRVVTFDSRGKELSSFPVAVSMKLFGGRLDVQPNGRVLVPFNGEDKVVEFDQTGQQIWSVSVPRPVAAVRLANGNTLVTSMLPETGAVEFDHAGREVWSYQSKDSRVTRALRR